MSKVETAVLKAYGDARKIALAVLTEEAKRVLPKGWTIHIACGWGLVVYDDQRRTVMSDSVSLPARLPRGVRKLIEASASFYDLFGAANETISSNGVGYPA